MPPKKYYKKHPVKISDTAKWLIIVESPSKCKKIEEYLGSDYQCISSKGHIRNIENLDAINIHSDYSIKFSIIEEKMCHIKDMLTIISQFSKESIIIATDDDREGEAIGWHICDLFDLEIESTKRIVFHEITKDAILNAVANPRCIDMNLVRAQNYRQVLDMLVGFKISPVLWSHIYDNRENALSAGRCQTPALKLIYDNKKEIESNPIKLMFKIKGQFLNKSFILSKEFETECEVLEFYKASQQHNHILSVKPPRVSYKNPPLPFNTSRLLQYASTYIGLSPKETMSLCQMLYQEGHITYMRTDSQKYAATFLTEAHSYLLQKYGNDEKIIGELDKITADSNSPHEAIRCCHINITSVNGPASTLYNHIWKNTVQSCMTAYKYKSIDLVITSPIEKSVYHHSIEIPLYMGWTMLDKQTDTDRIQEASTFYMTVNALVGSQNVYPIKYEYLTTVETIKNRGSHYTEASLIQKLEDLGIGRPSTYASIVDTLKERGYVKKENIEGKLEKIKNYILRNDSIDIVESEKKIGGEQGKLVIQFIGQVVLDFLYKYYTNLFEYGYTAKMEEQLDAIANGCNENKICEDCHIKIIEMSRNIDGDDKWNTNKKKETYLIDEDYVLVFEKYGPVIRTKEKNANCEYEYIKIKKDFSIDLDKLIKGEYTLTTLQSSQRQEKDTKIQRILTPDLSIRLGKYGSYIFYKTDKMKKPEFYKLNKFKDSFLTCEKEILINWIDKTYLNKK
jgi:DNA topoisomerase-1